MAIFTTSNIEDRYFPHSKDKTPTIADEDLLFWWAHQDLNLGSRIMSLNKLSKKTTSNKRLDTFI